jgi:SRSO17 transposase
MNNVQESQVYKWADEFDVLWQQTGRCFRRHDLRSRAEGYVQGLLGRIDRKNGWQMAEYLGNKTPHGVQRLLGRASWDAADVRDELSRYVHKNLLLSNEAGILIVDETGFLKKGDKSAGVQRQYSGTAGRIENCQIGVFLALAGENGRALIDRELYLPKSWCGDVERCKSAAIPQDVRFATKQQLAMKMLKRTFKNGITPQWVLGDAIYGSDSKFRRFLESNSQPYVLAVSSQQRLWIDYKQERFDAIVKDIPEDKWFRMSIADGAKGPRVYDWAAGRFGTPNESGLVKWMLFRRSVDSPDELAYYMCLSPHDATPQDLAIAAGQRWNIECCFEVTKQETGLDEYEVRSWHGWYRHVTLSMLAMGFLTVVRAEAGKAKPLKKTSPTWCR